MGFTNVTQSEMNNVSRNAVSLPASISTHAVKPICDLKGRGYKLIFIVKVKSTHPMNNDLNTELED